MNESFKRKAAKQRDSSHLSSSVKKEESKKRTKRETLTRKEQPKPRKSSETKRRTPNTKTPSSSSRSRPKDKDVAGTAEQPLDQGREVTITWDKQGSNVVVPGTHMP